MPNAESDAVEGFLACHDFPRRLRAREFKRFVGGYAHLDLQ
jgi:hypothetical protein